MKENQVTKNANLIRTDFSDENIWKEVLKTITTPSKDYGFVSYVTPINDIENQFKTPEHLIANLPKDYKFSFLILFDSLTVIHKDNILLCVDLSDKQHKSFRVKPCDLWMIENNLSVANMDFEEFSTSLDSNQIFDGFKQ
ncbi:MAG: hypothetical protein Q8R57_05280 [Bacteroidota bacterium]|nr:hypothetical protein [Bacteroidota bacterium]